MTVIQTDSEAMSPVTRMRTEIVVDNLGSTEPLLHRDLTFDYSADADYHQEYLAFGSEDPVTIVEQSESNALDISAWPIIRRNGAFASTVTARFTNGRAITSARTFNFTNFSGSEYTGDVVSVVADSLFETTHAAVVAVAEQLTSNMMWNPSGNRAQTSAIPHSYFTGQVWNGGGTGAGFLPSNSGKRFMAITRRHLFSCGHYAYSVGQTLYWKDVNNNLVSKQVTGLVNVFAETAGLNGYVYDMSIYLLDSDLPESITVLPVLGEWGRGVFNVTTDGYDYCPQICGLALLNNDGHIQPSVTVSKYDFASNQYPLTYEGIYLSSSDTICVHSDSISSGVVVTDDDSIFNHVLRGGDSGSPIVIPCAEGWCYGGHTEVTRANFPIPSILNQLIDLVDFRSGVSTGYTVTAATDPTL